MLEFILTIDVKVFYFINKTLHNPFFDLLMPFATDFDNWKIPILVFVIFLCIRYKKKGVVAIFCGVVAVGISDQLSSGILKPLTERERPCFELPDVRLLMLQVKSLSFPSSHAANITSVSLVFSYFFKKSVPVWITIVIIISYSRIYVGVHYPFDVLAGNLVGILSGIITIFIYKRVSEIYKNLEV